MMVQPIWPVLAGALLLLGVTALWTWRRWPGQSRPARIAAGVRLLLTAAAVVIGLHPVGTVRVSVPRETTTDVVIVVDRTTSMGARDYADGRPRMTGAAADLPRLVEQVAGARVAVIVFDDDARLAVPFTTDATTLAGFWQTVGWRPSAKASGSDVAVAADLAEQLLRRAAEERPGHDRYLVYVGDGEQTAATPPTSFAPLRGLLAGALVLGYGTEAGGPMATSDDSDELIRVDGQVQLSRIDEPTLAALAEQTGGAYQHRTAPSDLPELVPSGSSATATAQVPGDEYYWIVAIAASGGLLYLLAASVAGMRAAREELSDATR